MAKGSLVKINEYTVSSAVASLSLTGIDTTYTHYILRLHGMKPSADEAIYGRFTESGTANDSANYDWATRYLKADTSHAFFQSENQDYIPLTVTLESDTNANANVQYYIMNAGNSAEYTFMTIDEAHWQSAGSLRGIKGSASFTVTSAVDGIFLYLSGGGNFTAGKAILYGLKK